MSSDSVPPGVEARRCGAEVSRLEGFSDAVMGFALTLLVLSLDVPTDFERLIEILKGLPAFAACFALLVWVWYMHYKFFRRYGLQDRTTIFLNSVLLFVVLVYVYPLKFLFVGFMSMMTGISPHSGGPHGKPPISFAQVDDLFIIYGAGFVVGMIRGRKRERLALAPAER